MPLFYIATLGCKVNQYESQALREAWAAAGLCETGEPEKAAVILVNSCAVTAKAVADVRNTVRRLHRAAPEAAVIVTGCAAAPQAKELAALPGVRLVVPQDGKAGLKRMAPELARSLGNPGGDDGQPGVPPRTPPGGNDSPRSPSYPDLSVSGYERSRAVLKIQDGCSHGCAYCIVPLTRGGARSRPFAESLAEARRLLEAGFAEIVISGVNLRQYRQNGGENFWRFLSGLDAALAPEWAGRARFRLSSLEPGQLGGEALETLARCRMVAPHLHLSLQSGSPSVLRRMGRGHYDPLLLPGFLSEFRTVWPLYGLGADILTGFPGESDAEFAEGLELVKRLNLTYAHVFPYSKRPDTPAAVMPGQVPHAVKKERAATLRETARQGRDIFSRRLAALPELMVAFEDRGDAARPGGRLDGQPEDRASGSESGHAVGTTPGHFIGRAAARGVCEYYAECRLSGVDGVSARGLTRVRPIGVAGEDGTDGVDGAGGADDGVLLVAPLPEAVCG